METSTLDQTSTLGKITVILKYKIIGEKRVANVLPTFLL